jgi:hypothetical protein
MLYRVMIGATALAIGLAANGRCMATGAVAVGEPADISKDGVAIYTYVNASNAEAAKKSALEGCRSMEHASSTSKALCKVVATFVNQCVAESIDPESGTPGFGWAMAPNSRAAREQAISNCRDTAGPTRQDKCIVEARALWCDGSAK